ncbi:glutamate/gamma-aminobutyrate family transporter YjeM [Lactococcus garvieae]|uniref:Glutamate/gamma-aminobutyrate family transporter YjeM n=1 Tax=Lactococcus garvieae TaxID=1363 RepID=A0AA43PI49_9LACT|nr:glutamate/gamma-aminobutyrate family transporter YjeM [Lactococcus garvieae]MDH7959965.1 glutamate/gamma-aminobutyrate family transporter YjeM [Lactococcus garvieae]BDM75417.1 amino acid permease [Lactococcus garvieae]BDW50687.1 amino acid permease [Lactococcus garvieae]
MSDKAKGKLSLVGLCLMIFTSVYGFNNIPRAFYMMGYAAIPWYIVGGLFFFLPFAFMVTELGSAFKEEKGGIYSWMEKAVGPTFAFVGTFMWYASYLVWMVNVSNGIMVPITNMIFGNSLHVPDPWILSIIAMIWVAAITFFALRGLDAVKKFATLGGIAVLSLNAILLICALLVLILNGHPTTPITAEAFVTSLNPNFNNSSAIGFIAFMVFAIFAYGGVEAVGGLVDETDQPEKNFPRGVVTSALIIAIGYSVMILCVGFFMNYQTGGAFYEGVKAGTINLGNAGYVTMQYLGEALGAAFGMSHSGAVVIGSILARYMGLAMLLSLMGAFFTLIYSPVKQIISGTPDKLWPGRYGQLDKESGMPKFAMVIQFVIVFVIILLNMLINLGGGAEAAAKFFAILTNMANVAMTLPYLFIVIAYAKFKLNDNIEKPFTLYKSKGVAMVAVTVTFLVVAFANAFTVIQPITDYFALPVAERSAVLGDTIQTVVSMIAGPVIFGLVAFFMMNRYKKRYPAEYASLTDLSEDELHNAK